MPAHQPVHLTGFRAWLGLVVLTFSDGSRASMVLHQGGGSLMLEPKGDLMRQAHAQALSALGFRGGVELLLAVRDTCRERRDYRGA